MQDYVESIEPLAVARPCLDELLGWGGEDMKQVIESEGRPHRAAPAAHDFAGLLAAVQARPLATDASTRSPGCVRQLICRGRGPVLVPFNAGLAHTGTSRKPMYMHRACTALAPCHPHAAACEPTTASQQFPR